VALCDVLIGTTPLKVRQLDVLFISRERLDRNPPAHEPAPLYPAPELVVEIISPSDRPGVWATKLANYRTAEVREVWVVSMEAQAIELVDLSGEAIESPATYHLRESLQSMTFPGLMVSVHAVFEV